MKRQSTKVVILAPLAVMLVLLVLVLLAHRGMQAQARPAQLAQLSAAERAQTTMQKYDVLLLSGGEDSVRDTVVDALGQMRITWREEPAESFETGMLTGIQTVLYLRPDLTAVNEEELVKLFSWVESGGHFAVMMSPTADDGFAIVYRKLGVMDVQSVPIVYESLAFKQGTLPLQDDRVFAQALRDYTLSVRLESDCDIQITTGDGALPLMWTRDLGLGRVAVFNANLMLSKDARGYVANVLSVLEDALVYPIINAGVVFIDDFPAPQPEGFDERLMEQYGFNIQGFFRNHWWPDMKQLTYTNGLRYTGMLVETYNDNVTPPFEPDTDENALIRYYASEILQSGGEIGLQGYNHQPLCPDGFTYPNNEYKTWASKEDMALAITELMRYGKAFLPNAQFACYMPPSNYLSPEGQEVLLETVPGLRTISGLYLPETGVDTLTQEFREEEDGSISVPCITSGFSIDDYNRLVLAQELALHGVVSHFIHPDDVLDDERGAALGWEKMYADFETIIKDIAKNYPDLRWSTASEAAAAVQRFDRVQVERTWAGNKLLLTLSPFYDEVWLALWCDNAPTAEGAEVYHQSGRLYWLRATSESVTLRWGVKP